MRISRAQVEAVLRSYLDQIHAPGTSVERLSPPTSDKVTFSDDARQVSRWVKLARTLPEVRAGELHRVRSDLAQGSYEPSSKNLAEKILDRLLTDRALEEQSKR